MTLIEKYQVSLSSMPEPGGNGCHPALLGTANLGILAGLDQEAIFSDIRQAATIRSLIMQLLKSEVEK